MSEEAERIYTINLGKVLLSPNNIRAKRAINMIKEFTMHHMKTNSVRISEDVAHYVWKRGIKHPPRKIRVGMERTDEGFVLVYMYDKDEAAADAAPAAVEPTEPELPEQPPSQEGVAELPEPEDLDLRVPDIKTTSQEGVAELPEPEDLDLRVPDIKTTSQEGVAELPEPDRTVRTRGRTARARSRTARTPSSATGDQGRTARTPGGTARDQGRAARVRGRSAKDQDRVARILCTATDHSIVRVRRVFKTGILQSSMVPVQIL
jgi:large subunit ribosomal protein L31e